MAYDFNGTNQWIGATLANAVSGAITSSVFFNRPSSNTGHLLTIQGSSASTPRFTLQAFSDQKLYSIVANSSGNDSGDIGTSTTFSYNAWNHGAARTNGSNEHIVLLNNGGGQVNTTSISQASIALITIARILSREDRYSSGLHAEAAIWNVALTDDEIASLAKGFKPTRIRPQSLVFYAPLVRNRYDLKGSLALAVNGNLGRVNLLTYSEEFNNAAWTLVAATLTNNAAVAPDGATTAEKYIPNNGVNSTTTSLRQDTACAASTQYTASIYAKAAGQNSVDIRFITRQTSGGTFIGDQQIIVNLTDGTYTTTTAGTPPTSASFSVSSVGNDWYRISITATTNNNALGFRMTVTTAVTGNGTDGVFVWGAQLEQASSASDYQKIAAATDYQPVGSAITAHPRVY